MTEGRQEKLAEDTNDGTNQPKKGQLELVEHVFITGYVGFFGEGNTAGEVIEKDSVVLRSPKWLGTDLSKDDIGIKVMVAVPKSEMPKAQPDLSVSALEREVAELKAQLTMPLTAGDVTLLKSVLSAEKVKLGDSEECLKGLALIEKLDGYLHPQLPFKGEKEEVSETTTDPEADDDETEE